jgi:hypothetical protein
MIAAGSTGGVMPSVAGKISLSCAAFSRRSCDANCRSRCCLADAAQRCESPAFCGVFSMVSISSWKLALAAAALSGVAMSASANQSHPVTTPAWVVKGEVTAVRIIARAGRRDLKKQQKKRARNKKMGRYSSKTGLGGPMH